MNNEHGLAGCPLVFLFHLFRHRNFDAKWHRLFMGCIMHVPTVNKTRVLKYWSKQNIDPTSGLTSLSFVPIQIPPHCQWKGCCSHHVDSPMMLTRRSVLQCTYNLAQYVKHNVLRSIWDNEYIPQMWRHNLWWDPVWCQSSICPLQNVATTSNV